MQASAEIIQAIQAGEVNKVAELIAQTPELSRAKTEQGISLLMLAAYSRQFGIVEILLSNYPALTIFEACALGKIAQVQEILKLNPSLLNAYAEDGFYPSGLAVYFGHNDLAQWLFEQGAEINQTAQNPLRVAPLHAAVSTNNFEMVSYLLQKGANVNQPQQQGVTPLHGAAHNGNLQIIKVLLENGADLALQTETGQTPLAMAEEMGKTEVVEYLKQYHL